MPIVTLDILEAPTNRAKCHHCQTVIKKGELKGVIEVTVEIDGAQVNQNRSLCRNCATKNVTALSTHLQNLLIKLSQ
jgi:hypothetical protein